MNSSEVWKAVEDQASAWAATPAVRRFSAPLPRNATQRSTGLPGALQAMQAAGAPVEARPLRMPSLTPMFRSLAGPEVELAASELADWLEVGARVERSHRETIAWLRSRLSGYPSIPAPQLVANSPLTTLEFTYRLTWSARERLRGLQFLTEPAGIGDALEASAEGSRRIGQSARTLVAALSTTDEWVRLDEARSALHESDHTQLRDTKRRLQGLLHPQAIDVYESSLAMRRQEYRNAMLTSAIAELSGNAREFVDAFDSADRMLENVASDVFGQLAVYIDIATFSQATDFDLLPGTTCNVEFTVRDETWPDPGMVVWVDDALIVDAVFLEGVSGTFDLVSGVTHRVTGTILSGTRDAWRPSPR